MLIIYGAVYFIIKLKAADAVWIVRLDIGYSTSVDFLS